MSEGAGLAEALLGLPGFRVLEVSETPTSSWPGSRRPPCSPDARCAARAPKLMTGSRSRSEIARASDARRIAAVARSFR